MLRGEGPLGRSFFPQLFPLSVGEGIDILVANEPGFMLLKIFAFNSRNETKDIRDIHFLLDNYIWEKNAVRADEELFSHYGEVIHETPGSRLLGKDVAAIIKKKTYREILPVLDRLFAENSQIWGRLERSAGLTEDEELAANVLEISKFRTFQKCLIQHFAEADQL